MGMVRCPHQGLKFLCVQGVGFRVKVLEGHTEDPKFGNNHADL